MEVFLDTLGREGWVRYGQVFLVVLETLTLRYAAKVVFDRLARQLERTSNVYDDAVLAAAPKCPNNSASVPCPAICAANKTPKVQMPQPTGLRAAANTASS